MGFFTLKWDLFTEREEKIEKEIEMDTDTEHLWFKVTNCCKIWLRGDIEIDVKTYLERYSYSDEKNRKKNN